MQHSLWDDSIITSSVGWGGGYYDNSEQFKCSLNSWLFECAYGRRRVWQTLTEGAPYKWTYLLTDLIIAACRLPVGVTLMPALVGLFGFSGVIWCGETLENDDRSGLDNGLTMSLWTTMVTSDRLVRSDTAFSWVTPRTFSPFIYSTLSRSRSLSRNYSGIWSAFHRWPVGQLPGLANRLAGRDAEVVMS